MTQNYEDKYFISDEELRKTEYIGYIKDIENATIAGFLYNKNDVNQPQSIDIYVNGRILSTHTASLVVKGIAGDADICCGFLFEVPELLSSPGDKEIDIRVAGTSFSLRNMPQTLKAVNNKEINWKRKPPLLSYSQETNHIIGEIDGLNGRTLAGWAADTSDPHKVLWLELLIDGKRATIIQAGQLRPELEQLLGNAYHGYRAAVPDEYFDGNLHDVVVRIYNSEFHVGKQEAIYFPSKAEDAITDVTPEAGMTSSMLEYLTIFPRIEQDREDILFDEDAYLNNYPDVREAISSGIFNSGYEHWTLSGRAEEERNQRNAKWRRVENVVQLNKQLSLTVEDVTDLAHIAQILRNSVRQMESLAPVFTHRRSRGAKQSVVGEVVAVSNGVLSGWLIAAPDSAVPVIDLVVDGKLEGSVIATPSGQVPLRHAGGHDFAIAVPPHLRDDVKHEVFVVSRNTGAILEGCPLSVEFPKNCTGGDDIPSALVSLERKEDFRNSNVFGGQHSIVSSIQLFDEQRYLDHYPDVRSAVVDGIYSSGYAHWIVKGRVEEETGLRDGNWRKPVAPERFDVADYLLTHRQAGELSRLCDVLSRTVEHMMAIPALRFASRAGIFEQREKISRFAYQPKISIVMPVYNVAAKWLRAAIESVIGQTYSNWELCIVDDHSPAPDIRPTLEYYSRIDHRIKVKFSDKNKHISASSNIAIGMATGDFIAFLDHDDEYTPNALFKVVELLNKNRKIDYIYSDEDKIDQDGNTFGAFYKPDWSPELLLTYMYTCHLSVYRASLLRSLGGLRSEFDGAQDFDMVLRFTEKTNRIGHIPEVLYHWRTLETSTAQTQTEAKDYAYERAQKALAEHVTRIGLTGTVLAGASRGMHRVRFDIIGVPKVSIIIPTAGRSATVNGTTFHLLSNLVDSIKARTSYKNYEIIVIDNGDLDAGIIQKLDGHGVRRVSYLKARFNLAEKMNIGAHYATGDYILIMNDDIEIITKSWLEEMLQFAQQKGVGAVGPKLLFPDDSIQHAGVIMLNGCAGHSYYGAPRNEVGHAGLLAGPRNVLAVTGACVMSPAALFREFGGFDEIFDLNYNDVDYCLRLYEAGYRIVYTPYAELYHFESMSRPDTAGTVRKEELDEFNKRWHNRFFNDPYYNVNLPNHTPYGFSR